MTRTIACLATFAAVLGASDFTEARVHRVSSDVAITACRFAAGDLDGDGQAEIVVSGRVGPYSPSDFSGSIEICRHEPGSGLTVLAASGVLGEVTDIAIGDIDGDGTSEIAAVGGSYLRLLRLDDDDVVATAPPLLLGPGRLTRVDVGDIDGDGSAEIAVVEMGATRGSEVGSSRLTIFSSWKQELTAVISIDLDGHVGDICFGDFDSDGDPELAVEQGFEELGGLVRTFGFGELDHIYEESRQQLSVDGARILNLSGLPGSHPAIMATGDTGGRVTVWASETGRFRSVEHFSLPPGSGLFHGLQFSSPLGRRLLAATARVGASRGELWELISETAGAE